jgi:hypothetical protein
MSAFRIHHQDYPVTESAISRAEDIEESGLVTTRSTGRSQGAKEQRQNAIQSGIEERGADIAPETVQEPRWACNSGSSQQSRRQTGIVSVEEKQF